MSDPEPCPGCAQPDLAFAPHDHARCAGEVLALAEARMVQGGQRMTPVRRRSLQILLEAHRALGAYDVLERLAAEGYGNQPPVAYRALEFLEENGLAHRIRRLNAFTACMHPGEVHAPAFLICRACGVFVGALMATNGKRFFTVNANSFKPPPAYDIIAVAKDFSAEDIGGRTARRADTWIPVAEIVE